MAHPKTLRLREYCECGHQLMHHWGNGREGFDCTECKCLTFRKKETDGNQVSTESSGIHRGSEAQKEPDMAGTEPRLNIPISSVELDWVEHAASLRGLQSVEYVRRAINLSLRNEGVDAVLLAESDDEYSEVERNCRGCMGPCGRCHELIGSATKVVSEASSSNAQERSAIEKLLLAIQRLPMMYPSDLAQAIADAEQVVKEK